MWSALPGEYQMVLWASLARASRLATQPCRSLSGAPLRAPIREHVNGLVGRVFDFGEQVQGCVAEVELLRGWFVWHVHQCQYCGPLETPCAPGLPLPPGGVARPNVSRSSR